MGIAQFIKKRNTLLKKGLCSWPRIPNERYRAKKILLNVLQRAQERRVFQGQDYSVETSEQNYKFTYSPSGKSSK